MRTLRVPQPKRYLAMNEEMKESLRELGASEAVIQASGGDLVKAIELGGMGRKLVKYGPLFLHDQAGSNFAIPPFDHKEFEIFFRRAGFSVPSEYLDYLIKTNGGNVGNNAWFALLKSRRQLKYFLSFKPSALPQCWINNASCKPLFFLEIALDSKEDYLVIKLEKRFPGKENIKPGSIWHIKGSGTMNLPHSEEKILKEKSCVQIADSFDAFIEMLECDSEIPHWLKGKEVLEIR